MTNDITATKGQTLTVGELKRYLDQFFDDAYVITYVHADIFAATEDYANINGASAQGEEDGTAIVVLEVATVTDNRGW